MENQVGRHGKAPNNEQMQQALNGLAYTRKKIEEVAKKVFPERFFDCGIAEANLICAAAGRAFEQVRNTMGYSHLNVKICATHGGISVGEDGASHQCCEDFVLMRSIPGMIVMSHSDDIEARQMIDA